MIYAYDKAILMPTMDLYDTGMMRMAVEAAKDERDKALKRMDDFYEKYNDFYTPFAKDLAAYQQIMDNFANKINALYAAGEDPTRSRVGRMKALQYMREIPTGYIALMKRNAAVGEEYLKGVAELKRQNKYNPLMAEWESNFNDFSTVNDNGQLNVWDTRSPSAYMNIDELLTPIVEKVLPVYDAEKSAQNPGKIYKTVTIDRLMLAFGDSMTDILSTPSGRFLLHQSLQEADLINTLNPNANVTAMDVFKNKAKNRLSDQVREEFQYDPLYIKNIEHKNRLGEIKYKHDLENKDPNNKPLQFSERVLLLINDKYNRAVARSVNDYVEKSMKNAKKIEERGKTPIYGSEFWKKVYKDINDPNISNKDRQTILEKNGLVDKYGNPTKKVITFDLLQKRKRLDGKSYWDSRSYTPTSDFEYDLARRMFSGTDRTEKLGNSVYNTISFGNGVKLAAVEYAGLLGNKTSDLINEFLAYLEQNRTQALADNDNIDFANIPSPKNGINKTSFRGNSLISENILNDFAKKYRNDKKLAKSASSIEEELIKELKLAKRNYYTEINNRLKLTTYYVAPTIRSTEISLDEFNQQYNKELYGANTASAERRKATEEGLEWVLDEQ